MSILACGQLTEACLRPSHPGDQGPWAQVRPRCTRVTSGSRPKMLAREGLGEGRGGATPVLSASSPLTGFSLNPGFAFPGVEWSFLRELRVNVHRPLRMTLCAQVLSRTQRLWPSTGPSHCHNSLRPGTVTGLEQREVAQC